VVTYEARKTDGTRFRNTMILTFEDVKIVCAELAGKTRWRAGPARGT
jgi:hypothetical protein